MAPLQSEAEVVQTTYGPVRGIEQVYENIKYKVFRGIPYAAPPVKNLRFKPPQPPQKWEEVKDVINYGPICHQPLSKASRKKNAAEGVNKILQENQHDEDCLSLNVYAEKIGTDELKPVLLCIHGGGFQIGDGTDAILGPEYLLGNDIVVVTINYRLGIFGFLATTSSEALGNMGLKDQVAALKWIRDNIAQFGGNPERVTIYGESAGAASVHFHLLSPLSQGLFHQAILSSGAATCYWATTDQYERFSKNLARRLGATENEIQDPEKRVKFLQEVDARTLISVSSDIYDQQDIGEYNPPTPFVPVVEPVGTEGAVITEKPNYLVAQGKFVKVPLLIGYNDLEGSLMNYGAFKHKKALDTLLREFDDDLCKFLELELQNAIRAKNDCAKVSQQIRDLYFDGKPIYSSELKFAYFFGDQCIVRGMDYMQKYSTRYSSLENPVYKYYFTFDGRWNAFKIRERLNLPGAVHADELMYVFKPKIMQQPELEPSAPEVITMRRMIAFYTNFVKYGDPTPSVTDLIPIRWEPVTAEEEKIMVVDREIKLETENLKIRRAFWDQLITNYLGAFPEVHDALR